MKKPKVIEHGVRWYFGDDIPECPECDAKGLGNFGCVWYAMFDEEKGQTAALYCKHCHCQFEPPRTEEK